MVEAHLGVNAPAVGAKERGELRDRRGVALVEQPVELAATIPDHDGDIRLDHVEHPLQRPEGRRAPVAALDRGHCRLGDIGALGDVALPEAAGAPQNAQRASDPAFVHAANDDGRRSSEAYALRTVGGCAASAGLTTESAIDPRDAGSGGILGLALQEMSAQRPALRYPSETGAKGVRVELEAPTAADMERSDEATALRARHDRSAFAEVYLQHRDRVFRYLRARCPSDDDALELTATTFEKALHAMPRYSTRGGGVAAWLLRIARNAAVDHERRRRPLLFVSSPPERPSPDPTPEEAAIGEEERRVLRALMAQLSPVQRDALALRFGAGMTAREISLVIGKSEEATQKLMARAIGRLKEDLR